MTVVQLRPSATTSNTGTLTGGATAHAVLSDSSDASFVTYTLTQLSLMDLTDLTLPAGAVIKQVQTKARYKGNSGSGTMTTTVTTGTPTVKSVAMFGTASVTSIVTGQGISASDWTDAEVDAATISARNLSNSTGTFNVYEVYFEVTYVVQPVVVVSLPTGTVTNTNKPTVSWADTLDSAGGAQSQYEVKIYSAAQYGAGGFSADTSTPTAASGILDGTATTWPDDVILPNATYRAYVRVAQTVNGTATWSAWAFGGFIINVALPAVPTLALTAEATSGRVKVDLTANAGTATTDRMELQRSTDGGATWLPVRNTDGDDGLVLSSTTRTIYDYEAPNGTLTSYRARSLHNYSGVYAASAWSTTGTVTWSSSDWWLKDPTAPALNLKLAFGALTSYSNVDRAARNGVFMPLGAALPVVVADTRAGPAGSVAVTVATLALATSLNALLDAAAVLLLQGPAAEGHPDRYVRIGDHSSVRVGDRSFVLTTRHEMAWVEVALPSGAQV